MVSINVFRKSEHFDISFVFVDVLNKQVTNFLLVAVHNKALVQWSLPFSCRPLPDSGVHHHELCIIDNRWRCDDNIWN